MSFFSLISDAEPKSLSSVVDYLAQKSNLCVKVLDRSGRVVAVNRRGLELLQVQADEICGQVWTSVWEGDSADRAKQAVETAFAGGSDRFTAQFNGTPTPTLWEIETTALEQADGEVTSVLVVSSDVTAAHATSASEMATRRDVTDQLGDVLHTFSNIASAAASSSRLLRNTPDPMHVRMVADHLEDSLSKANDALAAMRETLHTLRHDKV